MSWNLWNVIHRKMWPANRPVLQKSNFPLIMKIYCVKCAYFIKLYYILIALVCNKIKHSISQPTHLFMTSTKILGSYLHSKISDWVIGHLYAVEIKLIVKLKQPHGGVQGKWWICQFMVKRLSQIIASLIRGNNWVYI